MQRPHSEDKKHQHHSRTCSVHNKMLKKRVQVYAPTSYSEEDINSFYNNVDETLWKPNHYTIVMGDFNIYIGKRTNPVEMAMGKFGLKVRNERGGLGNIKKVQNHEYHVSEKSREEMDMKKLKQCNEE